MRHYGALQGQNKTKVCREFGQQNTISCAEITMAFRQLLKGRPMHRQALRGCWCPDAAGGVPQADVGTFPPVFPAGDFARNHQKCTRADRAILVVTHGGVQWIKHFTHVSDAAILKINVPLEFPLFLGSTKT